MSGGPMGSLLAERRGRRGRRERRTRRPPARNRRTAAAPGQTARPVDERVTARAVRRFAVRGALALAVVAVVATLVGDEIARDAALTTVQRQTSRLASTTIGPLVSDQLRSGDAQAVQTMDRVVARHAAERSIVRLKVWDESGTVLYSDEHRLIGQHFDLPAEQRGLLGTRRALAHVSELDADENSFERAEGGQRLFEVYAGTSDAAGRPLLVEGYYPLDTLQVAESALGREFVPLIVVALLALQLLQLPSAISLARRVERAARERRKLLQHAAQASELERRRMARELHDTVIQDLAGVGYALDAAGQAIDRAAPGLPAMVPSTVSASAQVLQRDIAALRQMLVDLYPPDLTGMGVVAAIQGLLDRAALRGVRGTLDADEHLHIDPLGRALLYRVAREALRNVVEHADATRVDIRLGRAPGDPGSVLLEVVDDGVGFDAASVDARREEGHLGTRLIADAVAEAGGTLTIASAPDCGTRVEARLPAGT